MCPRPHTLYRSEVFKSKSPKEKNDYEGLFASVVLIQLKELQVFS